MREGKNEKWINYNERKDNGSERERQRVTRRRETGIKETVVQKKVNDVEN